MDTVHFSGAGINLAASAGGHPSGKLMLLLHGGGQTRGAWRQTADHLIELGYYVVALDLRGHGDSDWAPDGNYSLDVQVADMVAVIGQLPAKPVLIGASMGGLVALAAAGEHPELGIAALVLVDVTPKVDPEGQDRIIAFMQANPNGFASVEEAAAVVAAYLPNRPRPSDPSGLKRNLRVKNGRYYWHWDPAFFNTADLTPDVSPNRYEAAARNITVPTLLVRGSHSELVKEENVRHFLSVIPTADYVDVQQAGHMVAGDSNDAFTAAVVDFLERKLQAPAGTPK